MQHWQVCVGVPLAPSSEFLSSFGFSETAIGILGPGLMVIFFLTRILIRKPQVLKVDVRRLVLYISVGVVGVVGVLGSTWCYAVALSKGVPLGVTSILTFLNYFIVVLFSRIIWKNKITPIKIVSGIATIIGIAFILNVFGTLAAPAEGLFWMAIVVLSFAGGFLLCKYAVDLGYDYDAYLMYTNLFAVIILSFINPPWAVVSEIQINVGVHGIPAVMAILGFGLIPMVSSYYFLMTAYSYLEAPLVIIMYSLDPVVASILGFLIFGQSLVPFQIFGIFLVLAALVWLQLTERALERKQFREHQDPVKMIVT
ncbi:DMT family transporter [Dehalobacterium formicoaceticum]|uniref:DMT family transporter n=1 Tax=Dehalobacterium formicoaceticum TaxID=51515 RepID=A0ABT1Y0H1_9FIRM|nr:EamA family transporter [Dehalobacterium formicoaceticum]MCR6544350.1 DMT family transporter [Dehalobacterium formicoaceticum]